MAVLAAETERIRFGPLVSSVTFRHPSMVARMAAQIDQLSGGRMVLGMGAGWNVAEHEAFGLAMTSTPTARSAGCSASTARPSDATRPRSRTR